MVVGDQPLGKPLEQLELGEFGEVDAVGEAEGDAAAALAAGRGDRQPLDQRSEESTRLPMTDGSTRPSPDPCWQEAAA
ncbi:hypothetical protein [Streptomyces sp. TRM70350]|uniref:hypothetical protein n=1 Tax=Streptomyces sp. TRM70350 TaxID=2856165 RepID=UPI001C44EE13|nr:hypothetical protein [Streptomyces sp. TRM70350]MBV7695934.1 hypothetical protein [Streptomyces sp. TRM70350]